VITFEPGTTESSHSALARAYPYEGVHIVIDLDAVRRTAPTNCAATLLAHVITHEVAHVLQGIARHSSEGMMKRKWTKQVHRGYVLASCAVHPL
jgi:hypothetical protein